MKLNPTKCAFEVQLDKFLGFMVSERGIEGNIEKVQVIIGMEQSRHLNEVQRLAESIAALNKFVSRSRDKCLPLFRVLRKVQNLDAECENAFVQLNEYLLHPPFLSQTMQGETLLLYLSVTPEAMSATLMLGEGKAQKPVYHISRALRGAKA